MKTKRVYKCAFVKEWNCYIENEEIPLEVCKLCIEAKKLYYLRRRIKDILF